MALLKDTCLIGLFIGITACSGQNSAQNILEDYLERVENVTGIESQTTPLPALIAYPSRRDRRLPIDDIRIGLLDYLKLYDCDLFRLINERNSTLGRIMPLSQKLVYEIKFLQGAESCYLKIAEEGEDNEGFIEDFQNIIQIKRANLEKVFWNATFDSPEMQKVFSLAVEALNPDEEAVFTNSRQALEYFIYIGRNLENLVIDIDIDELEKRYYTLQLNQYGGRLFQSIYQLTEYLNRVAYSLETVARNGPVCYQKKPNKKARILETVFYKFYIGRMHVYLSQIYQQGKDWLGTINKLIDIQEIQIPEAVVCYRAQMLVLDRGLWKDFEQATRRHTKAWQAVLDQCGLTPGSLPRTKINGELSTRRLVSFIY